MCLLYPTILVVIYVLGTLTNEPRKTAAMGGLFVGGKHLVVRQRLAATKLWQSSALERQYRLESMRHRNRTRTRTQRGLLLQPFAGQSCISLHGSAQRIPII